jgi:hypothetical protein
MEFIIAQKLTNGKKETYSLLYPRLGFAVIYLFFIFFLNTFFKIAFITSIHYNTQFI